MRKTVVGVIAVVAATSVFSLTGMGVASAAAMLPSNPPGVSGGFSPTAEAATLKTLHDSLESQWNGKNVAGMQVTQAALAAELAKFATPAGHAAMAPNTVSTVSRAQQENNQLGTALAQLTTSHGVAASDLPVPGVGSLLALVQSLLGLVLSLVTGLLGGLPVPLPVPPVVP